MSVSAVKNPLANITRISAKEARAGFADVISRVGFSQERMIIQKSGRDAIAVVPLSDLEKIGLAELLQKARDAKTSGEAIRASIDELLGD